MSEYSASIMKKYFKQVDEILLLGSNEEKCLGLVKGKVSFMTVHGEVMRKYLGKHFGVKVGTGEGKVRDDLDSLRYSKGKDTEEGSH